MAPPKPSSPPNPNPIPASTSDKKKKVTPLQVAFLVERYLADNGFAASLAAFRSDAAALFGRHSNKAVSPKGLLPLADILHDYITIKESRLAVDSAMQAMSTLVSTYYNSASTSLLAAAPPSSPPLVPPYFVGPTASSSPVQMPPPPTGTAGYATPTIHYTQSSSSLVVQNSSTTNNMSTPGASSLPTKKRKAAPAKSAKASSASKRTCTAPTGLNPKGKSAASQLPTAQLSSAEHSVIAKLPVQASSVAKNLFNPVQPQVSSSSCTPQQSYPIADEPASYHMQRPSPVVASAQAHQDIASSQYSIVSSKTLIVSPMKGGTYYSVERSCHVSSPLKSSTHRSKREHVKGRLDFDSSDARPVSTEHVCEKASTSTCAEQQDAFDIDFTNFDIFDSNFPLSELLLDFDLDNEGVQCENPSTNAELQRLQPISKSMEDPAFPGSMKPIEADTTQDINSQGTTSVTSVRAITKRIKIVSPVKGCTTS